MAEALFNEAERYLLENWAATIEVEESISDVRTKYQTLCEKVAESVRENHGELDDDLVEVTRIAGTAVRSGVIVLHRSSWPRDGKYPSGFWVENLRLEVLADADAPPPLIGLWLNYGDEDEQAERKVGDAARELLAASPLAGWKKGDNEETAILGRVVASKREILDMLSKADVEQFVTTLVEQFDVLARLIPAVDAAFAKKGEGRR